MQSMITHPDWEKTVRSIAEQAERAMPEYHERLQKALALVLAGCVEPAEGWHSAVVSSQAEPEKQYAVNGACSCPDATHRGGICKHRLAWRIYLRATQALVAIERPANDTEKAAALTVPSQYIQVIHGKPFVRYAGLLAMAHEHGLAEIEATFLQVSETLATAKATVRFHDGRVFVECGDATPENVHFAVRPHFARMALTRAKARALRDALNIGICSVEELD